VIDYDQQNSVISLYDPNTYSLPDEEWKPLLDHNGKPFVAMHFERHYGALCENQDRGSRADLETRASEIVALRYRMTKRAP